MLTRPKCKRCGVCCGSGPCAFGEEDEYGICIYLRYNDQGLASCQLLSDGKVRPEDISIGKGCVMRMLPADYEYHVRSFTSRIMARGEEAR